MVKEPTSRRGNEGSPERRWALWRHLKDGQWSTRQQESPPHASSWKWRDHSGFKVNRKNLEVSGFSMCVYMYNISKNVQNVSINAFANQEMAADSTEVNSVARPENLL